MKIVIVGPGALGCLIAAMLSRKAQDEQEIWLLDKNKQRAEALGKQGIVVEGPEVGNFRAKVRITAASSEIGKADLCIVCVKSYDTKEALKAVLEIIDEDGLIITLQNGIGNLELISESAGEEKAVGGLTNLGVTSTGDGRVKFAGNGDTVIGRLDGKIPVKMRQVRELFNKSGLSMKFARDIKGIIWSKLVINSGINALSAVLKVNNGKLIEQEHTRRIMRQAVTEAVRVAKRKRVKLIYDDPLATVEAVCQATSANLSSMLQDVLRKKRTEVDFINGVIVRQSQELGIPAPVNTVLYDLVKAIENDFCQKEQS